MEIKRAGSQPSGKGSADYFTGTVRVDPLFTAPEPARAVGASVTFEPGARTAWHTHPLGQTLVVTSGCGRAQRWGGPIEEIRPGDVIWFAPGEKHWHGAAPTPAMSRLAGAGKRPAISGIAPAIRRQTCGEATGLRPFEKVAKSE
jgi:quercetin dioxygenase-like cupin family protein